MINCTNCGCLHASAQSVNSACHKCQERYHEMFEIIRQYISEHPNCTIMELAANTNVSIKSISVYTEDEKICIR